MTQLRLELVCDKVINEIAALDQNVRFTDVKESGPSVCMAGIDYAKESCYVEAVKNIRSL